MRRFTLPLLTCLAFIASMSISTSAIAVAVLYTVHYVPLDVAVVWLLSLSVAVYATTSGTDHRKSSFSHKLNAALCDEPMHRIEPKSCDGFKQYAAQSNQSRSDLLDPQLSKYDLSWTKPSASSEYGDLHRN